MILVSLDEHLPGHVDRDHLEVLLKRALNAALKYGGDQAGVALTVVLTTDARLAELNKQFRDMDAPTDVLSFPSGETDPETGKRYLGDIVISYSRALDQANIGAHSLDDELRLLAVHGVLHLLGYDHGSPVEKASMWSAQADILSVLGSSITGPASETDERT